MPNLASIAAIGNISGSVREVAAGAGPAGVAGPGTKSFADLLTSGLQSVDAKVAKADALIQAYAVGDPVPVHQVTLAIAQARMAVEMAGQIRSKLVDTYHDFLNMQL
ncbi:flagellar hook-basal body complex protein FliE [Telmatospirillum sp.]|uniref:flagellar hook-basal body complex protein FliE n=1 Tax=Telmatospirillum sp. TaxID=2079197 RepID=UPI002848D1BA|nr:flagellar hook-basal body complex protein FliE [Telmatospirillum sp.]MDR3438092.1 flagellar hook-basal body complex protein FliE [Telmatospirillum sp.]